MAVKERKKRTTKAKAEKPAGEIDYSSPEELAKYDAKSAKLITEAKDLVKEYELSYESAKETAAGRKKKFECSLDELRALIEERQKNRGKAPPKVQATIPFPDQAEPVKSEEPKGKLASVLEDLWKEYPITPERWERFGLTAKDIEKLNAGETKDQGTHPILVYGDVQKFITPNPANPAYARTLKDFKGFGDKGMDRWTEADTAFWAWWGGGGNMEFAAEKGFTDGNATASGAGSEGAGDGNEGDGGEAAPAPHAGGEAAPERDIEAEFAECAECAEEAVAKPKRGRPRKAA